jgi:hypothetical protein
MEATMRGVKRLAGGAGLGYVAGVSIENMEALALPRLDGAIADIRAAYTHQALATVSTLAGGLALVLYGIFAVELVRVVRSARPEAGGWSAVALVGGIAGPLVAAVGLVSQARLIPGAGAGLSDEAARSAFELYLGSRMAAGILVAMFMLGIGVAALRSSALPPRLATAACAIAPFLCLGPLALLTRSPALQTAIGVAYGAAALWVFLTSLWLALADGGPRMDLVRRAAFLVLVIAAGLVGLALLAVPAATGAFFSWVLKPASLAAFAGGVYVGSAVVYAIGLRRPRRAVRGLVVGAVVLSVSVFAITLRHLDKFDFGRLQAWAWVVLFAGFSLLTIAILVAGGPEPEVGSGGPLAPWARAVLAAVAALLGVLAVVLWVDPTVLDGPSPIELPPLGGRFAGSWTALLAVLAGSAALRNDRDEARMSALALVALPAGALVGALRTLSELTPATAAAAYLAALAILAAMGAALLASLGHARSADRERSQVG